MVTIEPRRNYDARNDRSYSSDLWFGVVDMSLKWGPQAVIPAAFLVCLWSETAHAENNTAVQPAAEPAQMPVVSTIAQSDDALRPSATTANALAHNAVDLVVDPTRRSDTGLWFAVAFKIHAHDYYSVFTSQVKINPDSGERLDCHACAAAIGAVTYQHVADDWRVMAVQRSVGELGTWGVAPQIVEPPKMFDFGQERMALFLPSTDVAQGEHDTSSDILAFNPSTGWWYLGGINTAGDNSGGCGLVEGPKCWSYKGSISIASNSGSAQEFPDLLVTKAGTTWSNSGIIPARNELYVFNGNEYALKSASQSSTDPRTADSAVKHVHLDGWGKFKFGMSRTEVLVAGGPESHANSANTEISYYFQINGADYRATMILPKGYLVSVVLDDETAKSLFGDKGKCFKAADEKADALTPKYGNYAEVKTTDLAGIAIRLYNFPFSDGNDIKVMSTFSDGACRSAVIYNGAAKIDQGQF